MNFLNTQVPVGVTRQTEPLTTANLDKILNADSRAKLLEGKAGTWHVPAVRLVLKSPSATGSKRTLTFPVLTKTSVRNSAKRFALGTQGRSAVPPAGEHDRSEIHVATLADGQKAALFLTYNELTTAAQAQQCLIKFQNAVQARGGRSLSVVTLGKVWNAMLDTDQALSGGQIKAGSQAQYERAMAELNELLSPFPESAGNSSAATEARQHQYVMAFQMLSLAREGKASIIKLAEGSSPAAARSGAGKTHPIIQLAGLNQGDLGRVGLYLSEGKNGLSVKFFVGDTLQKIVNGSLVASTTTKDGKTSSKKIPKTAFHLGGFSFQGGDAARNATLLRRLMEEVRALQSDASYAQYSGILSGVFQRASDELARLTTSIVSAGGVFDQRNTSPRRSSPSRAMSGSSPAW